MQFVSFVAVFLAAVTSCQAEITLTKGVSQNVTFDGDDLLIQLHNPHGQKKKFNLCFGSSTVTDDEYCPQGYTGTFFKTSGTDETLKLSRKGTLYHRGSYQMDGVVIFGAAGTVNVLITDMPSGVTVTLPNAHIPTSTTATTVAPNKKASNKTIVLILMVTILVVVVVIVGVTVWYFCFCRRKKNQTAIVLKEPFPLRPNRTGQRVDNSKPGARNITLPPSAVSTTRTSTSTTKVPEKNPRVNPAPKPPPKASIANRIDCVSIRPASTQGSISDSQNH